jgi:hypothetical protein
MDNYFLTTCPVEFAERREGQDLHAPLNLLVCNEE